MVKLKKRYFVIAGILILISIPVTYYVKMLQLYYKFSAEIALNSDSIFREPKYVSTFVPETFNETTRLYYLCKTWGFLKYYHENAENEQVFVDKILLSSIPKAIEATNKEMFVQVLNDMISSIQRTPLYSRNPYPSLEDYTLVNDAWMNDTICLNAEIKQKLQQIFNHHTGNYARYVYNKSIGNIRLLNEAIHPTMDEENIRLLGLFRYWNLINYFYVYKNHMGEDWDEVLYAAIPRFQAAKHQVEYRKAIYRLTHNLHETHASLPPTIDINVFGPYRPNFRMKLINDTFVINKIRVPDFEKENFKVGDVVLQIDNQDVKMLSDSLGQFVSGGNYWSNQIFLCNAVLSRRDTLTRFTLLRGRDTLKVTSKNYKVRMLFDEEMKIKRANEKTVLYKWVNDSIAYLNLCSATSGNFKKNFVPIRHASAVILDLRNYPDNDLILKLTNAFVPPHSFFAYATYPDSRFPGMVRYCKSTSERIGDNGYYKGKVIVLVDELTQSFSEYTTMALQANPKTVTVGNNSSGSDGNVTEFEFPGGVKTLYSGIGIYYPDFTPTQRIGVRVDYIVEPTIESIKNGVDMALERAIHIAEGN